ncbi:2-succinyl-5-enolpyruvyl-6-hydroxy-3-cyclohexene-1-carboxylate synthase [Changchengzhania lutea]|uniref:2-succinyl-5-enolpyruvyl-6-hydroxy-3- cyclohexene-1-carboxylate synthase n=1 Tax=Changchengzhania lutea TaxID=2049305 RepID=UPI00115DD578|nr:thiamine pyrophosphate-binding protein [Changchengzhania lutea]
MIYPEIQLAQTVIQLCKAKSIKHIIISPGSRNAPLTIGFTNDDFFTCYSIVDERCAAFFALGIAQQLQTPTALVCTSGSALLNYYPAIAEAYYSDIPLVVLSTDRPKHLINIGDGQTINQKDVFKNHILYSANLKLDLYENGSVESEEELPIFKNLENKFETLLGIKESIQEFNESEINKAINQSILEKGPVHINSPFDEPLYKTTTELVVHVKSIAPVSKPMFLEDDTIKKCLDIWNSTSKKMVLVGVNYPNAIEQKWLDALALDDSLILFTETTSNLHNAEFFPSIDQLIAPLDEDGFKKLQPELLVTMGGLIVSKKIKAFLRTHKPKHHWHIDLKKANDTFFSLDEFIQTTPNFFFSRFLPKTQNVKSQYKPYWEGIKASRQIKHEQYLESIQFSDFIAYDIILKSLPNHINLQLSNSSTIRYTQLFNLNKTLNIYCNRGTSGIDGSTSTAVGCSVSSKNQTVFITGDLSFFYDSNALWNNYMPKDFRIILINNQGGGIFRILPGDKNTENFDTYFETKHHLTAEHLCNMYNFHYEKISNEADLHSSLDAFYMNSEQPKLLEIFTPRSYNDDVLLKYFEYLK